MNPKPPTCAGCPAEHVGQGYVPGTGPQHAKGAVIGQGPGKQEAEGLWDVDTQQKRSAPFIGPSGRKLDRWLELAQIDRSQLWVDNVVRCRLPKDRPPKASEVKHCMKVHVLPDLMKHVDEPVKLLAVGVPSAQVFLRPRAGMKDLGSLVEVELNEP